MFRATTTISHPDFALINRDMIATHVTRAEHGKDRIVPWFPLRHFWADVLAAVEAQTEIVENGPDVKVSHVVADDKADALRAAYDEHIVVDTEARMTALGYVVERTFESYR